MAPPIVEVNDVTVFRNNIISVGNLFSATDSDDEIVSYTVGDFRSGAETGYFRRNGVAIPNGTSFTFAASELNTIDYVGGSQISFEGFRVVARDEFGNFSSPDAIGRIYSVQSNISRPHVRAPFFTALANEVIEGKDIIYGFDPDGYPMTHFQVSEANRVLKIASSNGFITVTSYQHRFRTGDTITLEGANEGQYNRTASVAVINDHVFRFAAPGVANGEATGQLRAYNQDGGRFQLNGVNLPQGKDFTITAAQVKDLKYLAFGSTNEENIYVKGYDGVDWSTEKRGVASLLTNANRPVVQFSNINAPADELVSLKDTFLVTDADQNTMKYYWFNNTSPHAHKGDLVFKGAIMPRTSWFLVQAADMDQLFFKTKLVGDEQQIRIRAYDGKHTSAPGTLTIRSTPPIVRPEIEPVQPVYVEEQLVGVNVSQLFAKTDPGNPHTNVEVYEPTTDPRSGTLRFSETPIAGGVIHKFSKQVFDSRVNFYTGEFYGRSLDTVYVREQNETGLWSSWAKLDIRTEPEYEDVLTSGTTWTGLMPINSVGKLQISYSYMQSFPNYETGEAIDGDPAVNEHFTVFNNQQRVNSRLVFRQLEEFANVQFVEVADSSTNVFGGKGGIVRMGNYGLPFPTSQASAFAFYPGFGDAPGDMWFNRQLIGGQTNLNLTYGSFGYKVFMHELGHAMGLKHPHDGNPRLPPTTDFNDFTVMSYQQSSTGREPTTYQLYDINELQDLYGANMATRTGNNGYSIYNSWNGRMDAVETIWDAGGNDTLSAIGAPRSAVVDLRSGQYSSIGNLVRNINIAFGTDIENALGSRHNDQLLGNGLNNYMHGGDGDDYIFGNAGNDYMIGGRGDDTFEWGVGDGNDVINELGLGGTDTIRITEFPTVNKLEEDFKFRMAGNDLWIDLHIDGGELDNSIKVVNQLAGGNRIETLELGGTRIDLANLTSQVAAGVDTFFVTTQSTPFGQLVAPA